MDLMGLEFKFLDMSRFPYLWADKIEDPNPSPRPGGLCVLDKCGSAACH